MRILRAAGMLFGLAAALVGASPAVADGNAPTVGLSVGWGADSSGGGTAAPSSWLPFTALISIPSGRPAWTGTLVIRPKAPPNDVPGGSFGRGLGSGFNLGGGGGPIYQQAVTVRPDTPRTVVVYGQYPSEGTAAYEAVLTDSRGVAIATSSAASLRPNYVTIGILSEAPSADSLFRAVVFGAPPQSPQVRGHHFDKVENLPSNALALSGFHALVIDDFDSSTLSQAQAQALQDYVGFGGSLILGGGAGWRRSLSPLPGALVPLRPDSTGTASLGAVMELIGRTSDLSVPVAMGPLATGARVVLADGTGTPLIAESSYGSGRIVELTYDPALDPVFGTDVSIQGWTQVINRAVSPARSNSGYPTGPAPAPIGTPGAPPISGATGYGGGTVGVAAQSSQPTAYQLAPVPTSRFAGGFETQVFDMLANSPASALPPLGLLGAILVGYVILAGPANYLWARGRRRRELAWVTVPLIAVTFTGIAYGAGVAYRGSDFLVNEVQILRVAPNGSVDATLLDVLFAPRRGDFIVQAPDGSYTTIPGQVSPVGGATPDHVNSGRHPTLALNDLHVWGQRNFKIELPVRGAMSLETHLGISDLRVKGSIRNRGTQPIRDLALLTVSGEWAALAESLAPGATVAVDSPLGRIPEYSKDASTGCRTNVCVAPPPCAGVSQGPACRGTATQGGTPAGGGGLLSDASRKTLAEVAAGASVMSRSDLQALVGTVDPLPGITVGDRSPNRRSVAAVAEAVKLETIDVLPSGWAGARLVTSLANGSTGKSLTVWDFDLPARIAGSLVLQYGTPGLGGPIKGGPIVSPPTEVEVYDWSARSWSRLTYDVRCPGASTFCATLSTGQSANGLVRIRTKNGAFYNFQMQLLSTGGARS